MSADKEIILKILVVDGRPFQRRLITETLRALGRVEIEYAETADHCLFALAYFQPDIVIIDWDVDGGQGLALVKRLRAGEAGQGLRPLPVVMVASRNKASDVERARNCGVDEFIIRPFSTSTMLRRVREVQSRRREFVESTRYAGPCRRRRRDLSYDGPRRRLFDSGDKRADAPDVQIRKGLVRMYVERLSGQLVALGDGDASGMRDLCLASGQLSALAGDMKDALLMSASSSLFNYLKGIGADGALNRDVVKAHLDALLQLAELPNYQVDVRQTVTQQLSVMVTKKLRQAERAA
ncbi:MAG: PleD family two-component system response regulator [Hyphomonadaceae bacterium]